MGVDQLIHVKQRGSAKGASLLIALTLLAGVLIFATRHFTADKIVESERRLAMKVLYEIVPHSQHDNDLFLDTMPVPEEFWPFLGISDEDESFKTMHIARRDGKVVAVIVPSVNFEAYNGPMKFLIGVNVEDISVAGVRVTEHSETPGFAEYIEVDKSDWLLSFNGKFFSSTFNERQVVFKDGKPVDQLSGATITRKAVIRQVRKILSFYQMADPLNNEPENSNDEQSTASL